MEGMDCWNDKFKSGASRDILVVELETFKADLAAAKDHFDELNKENLERRAEDRKDALGEARITAGKIVNKIKDMRTVLQQDKDAQNLQAVGTPERVEADKKVEKTEKKLKELLDQQAADNEAFARLNKEDAEYNITIVGKNLETREAKFTTKNGDREF